ncbi:MULTISPECIES: hypothetical protein [unclassified Chryseobacterium]|nr:hypothetical protein [Chryseobacterium sp. ON_d1]
MNLVHNNLKDIPVEIKQPESPDSYRKPYRNSMIENLKTMLAETRIYF